MKGKSSFTIAEISEIKRLISLRIKADRSTQKSIRNKMRKIGFYGRDDFGIQDCQLSDFENLIRCGVIVIDDGKRLSSPVSSTPRQAATCKVVSTPTPTALAPVEAKEAENALIKGNFVAVNTMTDYSVQDVPGLYCIKLRKGVHLPPESGRVREDGIIYIGQASKSLRKRLWKQELNQKGVATFFRSMGAILGYLPPKGSLYGKSTHNYKFSPEDTEAIRKWMRQSLLVNWIALGNEHMNEVEEYLIGKYRPLVNKSK